MLKKIFFALLSFSSVLINLAKAETLGEKINRRIDFLYKGFRFVYGNVLFIFKRFQFIL